MSRPDWLHRDGPDQYRIAKIDRAEAEGGPTDEQLRRWTEADMGADVYADMRDVVADADQMGGE